MSVIRVADPAGAFRKLSIGTGASAFGGEPEAGAEPKFPVYLHLLNDTKNSFGLTLPEARCVLVSLALSPNSPSRCMRLFQAVEEDRPLPPGWVWDIPSPNVANVETLSRLTTYAKLAVNGPPDEAANDLFFTNEVDSDAALFNLLNASNYVNFPILLDACCRRVADQIKGKTPEEIRKRFNIKNDFTREEEEDLKRENRWAFE